MEQNQWVFEGVTPLTPILILILTPLLILELPSPLSGSMMMSEFHYAIFHSCNNFVFFFFLFITVRNKVKDIIDFIQDDERLRAERKKARKAKDKYTSISGDSMNYKYSKY